MGLPGDGAAPRRPGGGTPGAAAFGAASGCGDRPGVVPGLVLAGGPVSACIPVGAEHNAVGLGLVEMGGPPSVVLGVPAAPGAVLGAPGVPGVTPDRLEGGAAPSPTSGSAGAFCVWTGTPAGPTIASSCP